MTTGVVAVRRIPTGDDSWGGCHAVEEASDELAQAPAPRAKQGLPEFGVGPVVVVDRLIHGIGVDLVGAVAGRSLPDMSQNGQFLRCLSPFGQSHLAVTPTLEPDSQVTPLLYCGSIATPVDEPTGSVSWAGYRFSLAPQTSCRPAPGCRGWRLASA